MTRLKNSHGFSAVEALLILVIVGILGFTGWFVYHSQKVANKSYNPQSSTQLSTTKKATKPTDPYAGWKQYCSSTSTVCFKYPSDWATAPLETSDPSITGVTITSASKTLKVSYTPVIQGIGGACQPGVCSFNTTSITTPADASASNLRIVKGVFESRDSGYNALPMYCVSTADYVNQLGLKTGEVNVGFTAFTYKNPKSSNLEMLCIQNSDNSVSYTSLKYAQNWLAGSDVTDAGKVLASIQLK